MGAHTNGRRADADVTAALDGFRRLVGVLRRAALDAERALGITAAQHFVLEVLATGGDRTVNELAAATSTHQSSVSVVARRLAERGLARRVVDPADRRRRMIGVTERGRRLLRRAPSPPQGRLIAAVRDLPAADRRRLAGILGAVVRRIGADMKPPTLFFEDGTRAARSRRATGRRQP